MNTDIADKSQELKRIVEAELQYDPVDDLDEEGESESDKEEIQEVLPASLLPSPPGLRVLNGTLRPGEGGATSTGLDFTKTSDPTTGSGYGAPCVRRSGSDGPG